MNALGMTERERERETLSTGRRYLVDALAELFGNNISKNGVLNNVELICGNVITEITFHREALRVLEIRMEGSL